MKAPDILRTPTTAVVVTETVAGRITGGIVMHNGDEQTVMGLKIEAVPAYNPVHMRSEGVPFHPGGVGNGYIVTFGDKRVYIAGVLYPYHFGETDTSKIVDLLKDEKDIEVRIRKMS
jgi:hypothetical protein